MTNNLRVYGVTNGDNSGSRGGKKAEETPVECEKEILSIIGETLRTDVTREDIEAVHRLRRKQDTATQRGKIARFVTQGVHDSVIRAPRNLPKSGIVIVEDLTPRAFALYGL